MPTVGAVVECPIHESFRVKQVAGMFDLSLTDKSRREFTAEVPGVDEDWQIGAIVGPSGSGKTTIAREAYGDAVYAQAAWTDDAAAVDGFGDIPIKTLTGTLTAVGFSSPPAWVRPYRVLSNGEQFRCDLARSLLQDGELTVFDEFTSVVDRTVAQIGSAAVSKAIRKGRVKKKFVAVTCHYDILEWLCPDWVVDMATGQLARSCLQRPPITIEVFRCKYGAWRLFAPHHYLSEKLHRSARCFLGCVNGRAASFCATLADFGRTGQDRVSRLVVFPDFQGAGIGTATLQAIRADTESRDRRLVISTSHPAMIGVLSRASDWRCLRVAKTGNSRHGADGKWAVASGRAVASFRAVASETVAKQWTKGEPKI